MTSEELAELFNQGVNGSEVGKGQVELEYVPEEGAEINQTILDLVDQAGAYLAAHPEGADRGGYVMWAEVGDAEIWYDPHDCSWVA